MPGEGRDLDDVEAAVERFRVLLKSARQRRGYSCIAECPKAHTKTCEAFLALRAPLFPDTILNWAPAESKKEYGR